MTSLSASNVMENWLIGKATLVKNVTVQEDWIISSIKTLIKYFSQKFKSIVLMSFKDFFSKILLIIRMNRSRWHIMHHVTNVMCIQS